MGEALPLGCRKPAVRSLLGTSSWGSRSGLLVSRPGYSGLSASWGRRLPHPVLPPEMGTSLAQLLLTVLPLPPVSVSLTPGALGESGLLSPRAAARPPGQVPRAWCPVHFSSSGSLRAFGPHVTTGRRDVWGRLGCAPTNGSPCPFCATAHADGPERVLEGPENTGMGRKVCVTACPDSAHGRVRICVPGGWVHVFLSIICHKVMSAFPRKGDDGA